MSLDFSDFNNFIDTGAVIETASFDQMIKDFIYPHMDKVKSHIGRLVKTGIAPGDALRSVGILAFQGHNFTPRSKNGWSAMVCPGIKAEECPETMRTTVTVDGYKSISFIQPRPDGDGDIDFEHSDFTYQMIEGQRYARRSSFRTSIKGLSKFANADSITFLALVTLTGELGSIITTNPQYPKVHYHFGKILTFSEYINANVDLPGNVDSVLILDEAPQATATTQVVYQSEMSGRELRAVILKDWKAYVTDEFYSASPETREWTVNQFITKQSEERQAAIAASPDFKMKLIKWSPKKPKNKVTNATAKVTEPQPTLQENIIVDMPAQADLSSMTIEAGSLF